MTRIPTVYGVCPQNISAVSPEEVTQHFISFHSYTYVYKEVRMTIKSSLIGLALIGFGAYQLARPEKWTEYIPAPVEKIIPLDKELIMRLHGSSNVLVGMSSLYFSQFKFVRWIVAAWWLNVLVLCGYHNKSALLRDAPFFLLALQNARKR